MALCRISEVAPEDKLICLALEANNLASRTLDREKIYKEPLLKNRSLLIVSIDPHHSLPASTLREQVTTESTQEKAWDSELTRAGAVSLALFPQVLVAQVRNRRKWEAEAARTFLKMMTRMEAKIPCLITEMKTQSLMRLMK
jgi:hypothetical protein